MSSVTISQTQSQSEREQPVAPAREVLTLRLVPKRRQKKKAVRWAEDVVDNENLGKKSSKKCCIYHKQQQFGEWETDDDSDCDECKNMEGNAAER